MATNTITVRQGSLQDTLYRKFGEINIGKTQIPACITAALNPDKPLRPYQELCFKYFLNYWENVFEGKSALPHLLFHMATGSGKTLIMAGLIAYLYDKGYRNFLFFVNSTNIIEKTKENFTNAASSKYLFARPINIGRKQVEVRLTANFQDSDDGCINLCLTTIQGLHIMLNNPEENGITYDDFQNYNVVMISDEAHHMNSATKKGKKTDVTGQPSFDGMDVTPTYDWESTVMRILNTKNNAPLPNVLLEFTATEDFDNPMIAEKYTDKLIFSYPLKNFREDGYSKDIEVVQSDLSPIDRAMQAVVLSQYKRKLFASIGQDIKPVIMMKSKNIRENKEHYAQFVNAIKQLCEDDLRKIAGMAKDDIAGAFSYFAERNVTTENLLLELKDDFKEDNLLIIDSNDISPEKQLRLNTLEEKDNEIRVVFAVDMLDEGWDVLNLYDIVRLYDTRDAKDNKPGKTTMREAQLIGRGARYMPFTPPYTDLPANKRKYDNDITNRLRVVEKLHYHSSHNPRYVQELHQALVITGMEPGMTRELPLLLKDSFKASELYKSGYVLSNKKEAYELNKDETSLSDNILLKTYRVRLMSGETNSVRVMEDNHGSDDSAPLSLMQIKMRDLGEHVIRAALNRFECYRFSALSAIYPRLTSMKEFIVSENYLAGLAVEVRGREIRSQKDKLLVAIEVLRQVEMLLPKDSIGYRGTREFTPRNVKDVFRDHILKVSVDAYGKSEYGWPMSNSKDPQLRMNLDECQWHAYNECYGTSEEKHLILNIYAKYPALKEKYQDIYLVRNESDLKIYDFATGQAFEPDYILFMRRRDKAGVFDTMQIFIEPKGEHIEAGDRWKENCLKALNGNAIISLHTASSRFGVWGLPFYNSAKQAAFNKEFEEIALQ